MPTSVFISICRACFEFLSKRFVLPAAMLFMFAIIGKESVFKWLAGQVTMKAVWAEIQANAGGFLDNPAVRIGFILLALWLFGKAALDVQKQKVTEEEKTRELCNKYTILVREEVAKEFQLTKLMSSFWLLHVHQQSLTKERQRAVWWIDRQKQVSEISALDTHSPTYEDDKRSINRNTAQFIQFFDALYIVAGGDVDWKSGNYLEDAGKVLAQLDRRIVDLSDQISLGVARFSLEVSNLGK